MGRLIAGIKDVNAYIKNINVTDGFDLNNITVEHRSNNLKRDYLFVNKKQCKHIPSSPLEMLSMCDLLSDKILEKIKGSIGETGKVLVIGFAETATAIGNAVGDRLLAEFDKRVYITQTTREDVEDSVEMIEFLEEHSHATNQKLLTYKENPINVNEYSYILFVEDEISTGNTILNFIKAFENKYGTMKYGVASICNWQNKTDREKFNNKNIDVFYLISGDIKDINAKMLLNEEENRATSSVTKEITPDGYIMHSPCSVKVTDGDAFRVTRLGRNTPLDISGITDILESIAKEYNMKSIRIIGTEEFMYIPILAGAKLESEGFDVICHSTTRSPIDIIDRQSNVLGTKDAIRTKYNVPSIYAKKRDTYIYNIEEPTDMTFLITDGTITDNYISYIFEIMSMSSKNVGVINVCG